MRDLPRVEAAGLTNALPLGRNRTWSAGAQGVIYKRDEYPLAFVHVLTEGYLKAAGIALKDGRDFTERDTPESRPVVLVNETLGRRLWPGKNPLGQLMASGNKPRVVVGVVEDVRHLGLEQGSGSEMYFSLRQVPDYGSLDLVIRSKMDDRALTGAVRHVLLPLDPGLPNEQFHTLQGLVDPGRFAASLHRPSLVRLRALRFDPGIARHLCSVLLFSRTAHPGDRHPSGLRRISLAFSRRPSCWRRWHWPLAVCCSVPLLRLC